MELHRQFLNAVRGLDSEDDINYILNLSISRIRNERERLLLESAYNGVRRNPRLIGYIKFTEIINDLMKLSTKKDIMDELKKLNDKDIVGYQRAVLMRILKSKSNMDSNDSTDTEKSSIVITKKCPHCMTECSMPNKTTYVVCGYAYGAFDWKGCKRDWCFYCGKKLCKKWKRHNLFIHENRFHTMVCCKKYASKTGYDPNDYCDCNYSMVNHKI
jgi:hypothetical protein